MNEIQLSGKKLFKLKKLLLEDISDYLETQFGGKGICMTSSVIVAMCLNLYKIKCNPRNCKIAFGNNDALDILKNEGEKKFVEKLSNKEFRNKNPNVWTVGLGFIPKNESNLTYFHTIIYFKYNL